MQGKSLYNLLENDDSAIRHGGTPFITITIKFPGEHMIAKHYGVRTKHLN